VTLIQDSIDVDKRGMRKKVVLRNGRHGVQGEEGVERGGKKVWVVAGNAW